MDQPLAYSLNDFCKLARISRAKVYLEINAGRLKARKLGTRTVILAPDADAYLAALPAYEPKAAA